MAAHGCVAWFFFFSSRRRHTRLVSDWSSDVCSSDLTPQQASFTCNIPRAALASAVATANPGRASLYGHGLFGSNTEVNAGNVESMGNEIGRASCRERE